jgi:hypothetical protein
MAVAGHPRRMKMGRSSGLRRRSLGAVSPLISLDQAPPMVGNHLQHQAIVASKSLSHRLAMSFP